MKHPLLILFFCLCYQLLFAQNGKSKNYKNELSFTTENDAYLLQYHDAYYTNGLFLKYGFASEKNKRKKISSIEIGQMIYTPINKSIDTVTNIDRPYCGYLYAKYQQTVFTKKDALFQWSASLGFMGKATMAEALQNSYHQLFHYKRFMGWPYQVTDVVSLDFGMLYAQTIFEIPKHFKIVPVVQANVGTGFINAQTAGYICWGKFEKNAASALWNARISNNTAAEKPGREFFLYALPQLIFQQYNATIQGSLFNTNTIAVLSKPNPVMFQQTIGGCYAYNRFTTKIEWVFQSKEAIHQQATQQYLSFQFHYRF